MAIGRITGPMLFSNLDRQGVNLAIDANLVYADVSARRVGISTSSPQYTLDVNGNAHLGNLYILNDTITSSTGKINLGSTANLIISGGSIYNILYTDGAGDVAFASMTTLASLGGFTGNNISVGTSPSSGDGYGTNALTTGMNIADAINTLDNILGNITNIGGNVITTGNLYLKGVTGYNTTNGVLISDGTGATSFVNANTIPAIVSINSNTNSINANITAVNVAIAALNANVSNVEGNTIVLGANTVAALTSNAVTLTQTTKVTDAIAQLNYVLGKLVPPAPPTFPGSNTLTLSTATSTGRIANFTQTDNSGWGNLSVAAGTSVSATRVATYAAGTITTVGPGDSGTVTAYFNGVSAGSNVLVGGGNGTFSNLIIASNQDYHNVVSSVTAGFWYSFNASLSGSNVPAGWNRANIADSATNSSTNTVTWYYDSSTPGTPTFSNTSIALYSNSVAYSSTIPHFTSSASFIIKGNVARLSGDTYPLAVTSGASQMVTSSAGGAIQAPVGVSYTTAGVTVPLARNLYVSSGSAYFETTASVSTGFGASASGPSLSVNNNYASGTSGTLIVTGTPTILYKTGTTTNIEETSIPVTSVGTGSGNAYRILNPGSTDTPVYTGTEAAFNSQTSTLQTYDATNVGNGTQGVVKFDQTNYSTGYLPVGPNLSGQGSNQYFTFKFVRTSVSKFDIAFTGTIAGLWVALPGSSLDTSSTLNGWATLATAYAGAGYPGAGTGGNGSNGCALGGVVSLGTSGSQSITATFGTLSSSSTATNEIYVRIKLTSGQSLTALSIVAATH
jgi:hypothetical protein